MQHLIDAVRNSLGAKNWEAALILAINLPDICAKIEGIEKDRITNSNRYVIWAREWIEPKYVRKIRVPSPPRPSSRSLNDGMETLPSVFRDWMAEVEYQDQVFMSAEDLYALRCAYTHAAQHDLAESTIKRSLSSFHISAPDERGNIVHLNHGTNTNEEGETVSSLQIQVDIFCLDICEAVEAWRERHKENPVIQKRLADMPRIIPFIRW